MTVCIAGICQPDNPSIILCSDGRIENEYFGGEVCWKTHLLGANWLALVSGDVGKAAQLLDVLRARLDSPSLEVGRSTIHADLQECAFLQRKKLSDELVQTKLSVSFDHFIERGIRELPEDIHRQMLWDLQGVSLACELILVGFIPISTRKGTLLSLPRIFVVSRDGVVTQKESFAITGSGWAVAESALFQRGYKDSFSMFEALYSIYEAKRFSEIAPDVGYTTNIIIVQEGSAGSSIRIGRVDAVGVEYLEKHFQICGLQPIRQLSKVPPNFFSLESDKITLQGKPSHARTKGDP